MKIGKADSGDPLKNRRTMAWVSFAAIIFSLLAAFFVIFWGSQGAADRANAVSGIIIAILLFLTGSLGDYSYSTRKMDKGSQK